MLRAGRRMPTTRRVGTNELGRLGLRVPTAAVRNVPCCWLGYLRRRLGSCTLLGSLMLVRGCTSLSRMLYLSAILLVPCRRRGIRVIRSSRRIQIDRALASHLLHQTILLYLARVLRLLS